jgi:hypothetical protein
MLIFSYLRIDTLFGRNARRNISAVFHSIPPQSEHQLTA